MWISADGGKNIVNRYFYRQRHFDYFPPPTGLCILGLFMYQKSNLLYTFVVNNSNPEAILSEEILLT